MNIIQQTDKTSWNLNNCKDKKMKLYIENLIGTKLFEGTLIFTLFPGEAICLVYPDNFPEENMKSLTRDLINDLGGLKEAYILDNFGINPKFSQKRKIVLRQQIYDKHEPNNPFKFRTFGTPTTDIKDFDKISSFSYQGIRGEALIFLNEEIVLRMTEYTINFRAKDASLRAAMEQNIINGKYGEARLFNGSTQDYQLSLPIYSI